MAENQAAFVAFLYASSKRIRDRAETVGNADAALLSDIARDIEACAAELAARSAGL
jgi:hypothetical protein